jgi:hypothetical protein
MSALETIGQGEADCERNPAPDDGIASIETGPGIEEMHRAAPPPAAALHLPVHLGHDLARVYPAGKSVTVFAIGGHHSIIGLERLHHSDGNRLLTDVQMEKSTDLLRLIELGASLLEPANPKHPPEKIEEMSIVAHNVTYLPASRGRRSATQVPKP